MCIVYIQVITIFKSQIISFNIMVNPSLTTIKSSRPYLFVTRKTFENLRSGTNVPEPPKKKQIIKPKKNKKVSSSFNYLKMSKHDSFLTSQNSNFVSNLETSSRSGLNTKQQQNNIDQLTQTNFDTPLLVQTTNQGKRKPQQMEYQEDIFQYLREVQKKYVPKQLNESQGCHNPRRNSLAKWIMDLSCQIKFNLNSTALIAINIMDRALGQFEFKPQQLPLLGITCLFMAGKFEELAYPSLNKLVSVLPPKYQLTKQLILSVEDKLLQHFDFSLNYPSPIFFINFICKFFKDPSISVCSIKTVNHLIIYTDSRYWLPSKLALRAIDIAIAQKVQSLGENNLQVQQMCGIWMRLKRKYSFNY